MLGRGFSDEDFSRVLGKVQLDNMTAPHEALHHLTDLAGTQKARKNFFFFFFSFFPDGRMK